MAVRLFPHPPWALLVFAGRVFALGCFTDTPAAVEASLGPGLFFADVLQPLDAHVGDLQQDAAGPARHVDAWIPGWLVLLLRGQPVGGIYQRPVVERFTDVQVIRLEIPKRQRRVCRILTLPASI